MADHRTMDAAMLAERPPPLIKRPATWPSLAIVPELVPQIDTSLLHDLQQAIGAADPLACLAIMQDALAAGLPPDEMAETYIPALARYLGICWEADEIGFVAVTIGSARLQTMLRKLGLDWSGHHTSAATPPILLILPENAQHTLGVAVLTRQLRARGFSVRLLLGAPPDDAAEMMQHTHFQSIFISASQSETLESLSRIVDAVRAVARQTPPIVLGGSILQVETAGNVTARTGADYANSNPDEALRFCGLKTRRPGSVTLVNGT